MKLFISQPMSGYTNEEILKVRDKAYYDALKILNRPESNVDLINSFIPQREIDKSIHGISIWYLGNSIAKMSEADVVYFCKGWKDSRGCRIEHKCAEEYEIPIIEEDENDESNNIEIT